MEKTELKITTKRHPDVLLENIKRMITDPRYRHTDTNGYHYIYYSNSSVMADMNTTKVCVISMFKELESKHLIYREAKNGGSPKKIYLIGKE
jgi:hypothetical protein